MEEEKENQEINARSKLEKREGNSTMVPLLLEKLSSPGQMPLFYRGGLEILSQTITDCECPSEFAQLLYSRLFLSVNELVCKCCK